MQTKQQKKDWRLRRLAEGLCPLCGLALDDLKKRSCTECRAKILANQTRRRHNGLDTTHRRLRKEVLELYGNKCVRCGFNDWRALQIDHVNGDGYKEKNRKSYYSFLKRLKANPDFERYQALCANCNWIKRYENNENANRN